MWFKVHLYFQLFPACGSPKNACIQMIQKSSIAEVGRHMTKCCVKSTSAIVVVIPGKGMQLAHAFTFAPGSPVCFRIVAAFIYGEYIVQAGCPFRAKLVPLIGPELIIGKALQTG